MDFSASPAAHAHVIARGGCMKATTNWTVVRRRYREAREAERTAAGIGSRHPATSRVVLDEGILFVNTGAAIFAYTEKELGLV